MFLILTVGSYEAFKYFSGTDPLRIDPKSEIISLISSSKLTDVLAVLGVKLPAVTQSSNKAEAENEVIEEEGYKGILIFSFAVVADSHSDNSNLEKALRLAREKGAKFVIGLGDFSQVGTKEELGDAHRVFSSSGLPFYVTAGDHDLWDARDKGQAVVANFNSIFGPAYGSFVDSNIRFILVDNADNYKGVDSLQMEWLRETLAKDSSKAIFVFLHEPLIHPTSDRHMGSVKKSGSTDEPGEGNRQILAQAQELVKMFKVAGVKEVFAGDIHAFTRYKDEVSGLKMTTSGALTAERNTQNPRFLMIDVFENGGYNVLDTEIR